MLPYVVVLEDWEIAPGKLKLLDKKLGEGQFGIVRQGLLTNRKGDSEVVAVKTLKGTELTSFLQINFLIHSFYYSRILQRLNILFATFRAVSLPVLSLNLKLNDMNNKGESFRKRMNFFNEKYFCIFDIEIMNFTILAM